MWFWLKEWIKTKGHDGEDKYLAKIELTGYEWEKRLNRLDPGEIVHMAERQIKDKIAIYFADKWLEQNTDALLKLINVEEMAPKIKQSIELEAARRAMGYNPSERFNR